MGADEANVVHLAGRVSAVLDERVLPSGDTVLPLRQKAARRAWDPLSPAGRPPHAGSPGVWRQAITWRWTAPCTGGSSEAGRECRAVTR